MVLKETLASVETLACYDKDAKTRVLANASPVGLGAVLVQEQNVSGHFARWPHGLMVSALVCGSSGPGLSPGQGHCVVFLGKTLYSHSASLHPGV